MQKKGAHFILLLCLFCWGGKSVNAADPSTEMDQMKQEVNDLLQRIEELEKKQKEDESKAVEAEKRIAEAEKKAEIGEKKALKDRVHLSGEARARLMSTWLDTPAGFYGGNDPDTYQPNTDQEWRDEASFPLRFRLNMWAEAVPDLVDVYVRLTMNKRWGAWDSSISSSSDPFNKPNFF